MCSAAADGRSRFRVPERPHGAIHAGGPHHPSRSSRRAGPTDHPVVPGRRKPGRQLRRVTTGILARSDLRCQSTVTRRIKVPGTSLINIRPSQGNRSMVVEDEDIRDHILSARADDFDDLCWNGVQSPRQVHLIQRSSRSPLVAPEFRRTETTWFEVRASLRRPRARRRRSPVCTRP